MKDLLAKQAELNKALDLDKNDAQVAEDDRAEEQAPTWQERVEHGGSGAELAR